MMESLKRNALLILETVFIVIGALVVAGSDTPSVTTNGLLLIVIGALIFLIGEVRERRYTQINIDESVTRRIMKHLVEKERKDTP